MGWQSGGGGTKTHTWFRSKFSNSSCIALTQSALDRACPISRGLKEATKAEWAKCEMWYDLDRVTRWLMSPIMVWGGWRRWICRGASLEEVTSPSTAVGASSGAADVGWGGCLHGPQVVEEEGSGPWAEVDVVGSRGAAGGVSSGSPQSTSSCSSSTKMLSPISWSPTHSKTGEEKGMVSSKVTSQVSTTWLVSRLRTRYAWEWKA
jgi:hypothetical protein